MMKFLDLGGFLEGKKGGGGVGEGGLSAQDLVSLFGMFFLGLALRQT